MNNRTTSKNNCIRSLLQSMIKPIYYTSKICGVAPFSFPEYTLSFLSIIYTIVLLLPVGMTIRELFDWQYPSKFPKTSVFLSLVDDIIVTSSALVSSILTIIRNKNFGQALKDITHITALIQSLGINVAYSSYFMFQKMCIPFVLISVVIKSFSDFFIDEKYLYGFFIAATINVIVLTQFCMFLLLYKQYYMLVNKELNTMLTKEEVLKNVQSHFPLFHKIVRNWKKSTVHVTAHSDILVHSLIYMVQGLREVHNAMYKLGKLLNSIYSVQILMFVANYITAVTVSLYLLYFFGVYSVNDRSVHELMFWMRITSCAVVALYNFTQLLFMVYACQTLIVEVSKIKIQASVILYK